MTDPRKLRGVLAFLVLVLFLSTVAAMLGASVHSRFFAASAATGDPPRVHPFQRKLDFTKLPTASFAVPSGKQLALRYVGGRFNTASMPLVAIHTTAGGGSGEFSLVMTLQARSAEGREIYVTAQSMEGVYADENSEVTVDVQAAGGGSFNGSITVSGILEDR